MTAARPRRPRGRPPARARERVAVLARLEPSVAEALDAAAEAHDLSKNWLINRAVADWLRWLLPPDQVVMTRQPPTPDLSTVASPEQGDHDRGVTA